MISCANEGHLDEMDELPPAVAKVSWPDSRFKPLTACRDCLEMLIDTYVLDSAADGQTHSVLVEMVAVTP